MSNPSSAPQRSGLWRILFVASLMLNLLVLGFMAGQFWRHGPTARPSGPAYAQFVPGRFFIDLSGERRRELADGFRASRQDVEKLRGRSDENAQKLAAELDQETYDPARTDALIDSFTTGPDSLAAGGSKVLKDFYAKLTPAERKQLAKTIREAPSHNEVNRSWRLRFWN